MLEFNGINPNTNKKFTDKEIELKKTQLSERFGNEQDSKEEFCCDPNDYKLQAVYVVCPEI